MPNVDTPLIKKLFPFLRRNERIESASDPYRGWHAEENSIQIIQQPISDLSIIGRCSASDNK
jgi:hypothetical protein